MNTSLRMDVSAKIGENAALSEELEANRKMKEAVFSRIVQARNIISRGPAQHEHPLDFMNRIDRFLKGGVVETPKCDGCGWVAGHDRRCAVAGDDIVKPNDDLPALKKWGDIVDGGAEKRSPASPKCPKCGKDVDNVIHFCSVMG